MTRQLIPVLLLLSFTVFLGCSSGSSSPTEPPQQAIFRGLILEGSQDEAPIADATVTVQGRSTMSAADGKCSIGGLDPGTTVVVTMKQGYGIVEANITLMPGENEEVRIHLRELGSGGVM